MPIAFASPCRKNTAGEHWHKAVGYYFDGDRRTIREAGLAMKLNPHYVRVHKMIGSVYLSSEPVDCEGALKEFRELVRKDPRWSEGHESLGRTLMRQGRTAEALKSFREELRLRPNSPWAQVEIGRHLLKRGEYREAVAVLLGKATPPQFCTVTDAHLLIAEFVMRWSYAKAQHRTIHQQRCNLEVRHASAPEWKEDQDGQLERKCGCGLPKAQSL